ncbi:MAG: SsrA-binding protein SmpB [Alphaproteobacteria bacterium]|nr:MAG: SsrA-binding protein SmpB [Alphaproteobacteria bacterium]
MISKVIATNRRAKFEYELLENLEVGVVLKGSEVKSCRMNSVSIKEAHVAEMEGALYLFNANIPEYKGSLEKHEPKAPRKLLMHKRELKKWMGRVKEKGLTIVPLEMYFNQKGLVKLAAALARGKKIHDKRETIKKREWERSKHRELKQ